MATTTGKITKPRTMSEIVLDRLRSDIIEDRFGLGEKISESSLSELYGVTKAPIRAAYIRLELEGLIEIRPQSGTYVFQPDADELRALCELRVALELEASRLAMQRNQAGLATVFSEAVSNMEEAMATRSLDPYQKLDSQLHLDVMAMAQSPLLERAYLRQVSGRFAALRYRFSQLHSHNEASLDEHKSMRDAVLENDTDLLLALTRKHTENTQLYYSNFEI